MNNSKPRVEIDPTAGFCTGVQRAIAASEKLLSEPDSVYCLGEIVHNEAELERLRNIGMKFTDIESIQNIPPDSKVLLRAHGEPPETYRNLKDKGLQVVDATCPVVLRLQQKVRQASAEMLTVGGTVLIYGKSGHAEVIGLMGQTNGNVRVINGPYHLVDIDFSKPLRVFSQTTSDLNAYNEIGEAILSKAGDANPVNHDVVIYQTICRQVSRRSPGIEKFARLHDVIIFVSGTNSSNGKYLSGISKSVNSRTFTVSGTGQIKQEWLTGAAFIGVSGATSTPAWLMQKVADEINAMI